MSIISVIYGNAYPVIVSDRAISDPNFSGKVTLPSTGKEPDNFTPVVGFRVKSLIVEDILCVAFAGLVSEIEMLHDYIVDYFLHREVNKTNVNTLIAAIHDETDDFSNVSVLLALGGPELEDNKLMVACIGDWVQDHSKEKLDIFAAGSGAREWINHFIEFHNYLESSGDRSTDCKQRALLACVKFTATELQTAENLLDGWGGGFDVVYYEDGIFHRYDRLTYSFLFVRERDLSHVMVASLNCNWYLSGNVVAINLDYEGNFSAYLVPQFRDRDSIELSEIALGCQSFDVATCIFIKRLDDSFATTVLLLKEWEPNGQPMFVGFKDDGPFRYAFKPLYWEMVQKSLKLFLDK